MDWNSIVEKAIILSEAALEDWLQERQVDKNHQHEDMGREIWVREERDRLRKINEIGKQITEIDAQLDLLKICPRNDEVKLAKENLRKARKILINKKSLFPNERTH